MASSSFVFIYMLHLFGYIFGESRISHFIHVMADCQPSNSILWKTGAPSLSLCCLHCRWDEKCLSVSYRRADGACVAHDVCPSVCSGAMESGWSTLCYEKEEKDCVGGSGGSPFTDKDIYGGQPITALNLTCTLPLVYFIQVKYGSTWGPKHGYYQSTGSKAIIFADDERIVRVSSSTQGHVYSMQFHTDKKTYEICGTVQGTPQTSTGGRLLYISGREGSYLDAVCFHWG